MALPLSILISSVMTFGNFGEHYELVAIKSSGISFLKTMRSLIVTSLVISVIAFFFSNNALPYVEFKKKTTMYDIRHKKNSFNIREGEFYSDIDGYVIRVGRKENKNLYDILIYDHTDRAGATKMTIAEKGVMRTTDDSNTVVLILENGWNYEESGSNSRSGSAQVHPMQRIYYESQIMHFDISGFQMIRADEGLFPTNHTMLNLDQLNQTIDSLRTRLELRLDDYMVSSKSSYTALHSPQIMTIIDSAFVVVTDSIIPAITAKHVLDGLTVNEKQKIVATALRNSRNMKQSMEFYVSDLKEQIKTLRKHEVIRQEKFTLSFACLVLFFIGAPLGSIIRKGGMGFPLIVATFLFIIYYVITMLGKKYAVAGELPIWFGAWLSTIVLFPFGLFLTSKANNDSPLFDFDSWKKISYYLFHKKKQHENTVTLQ
jgi:lipopolysaccharide export system permease protein